MDMLNYKPKNFNYSVNDGIALITLNAAKNPLTFDSYAELRDLFRNIVYCDNINTILLV